MKEFEGKSVFITGAAGGLGRALSRCYGRAGARLWLTDKETGSLRTLAAWLAAEGISPNIRALDVTQEEACYEVIQEACAVLPSLMERRGLIIVLSSVAGFAPLLGRTGYAASKRALHGLFESLQAELCGTGVRIMLVSPGSWTRTLSETPSMSRAFCGAGRAPRRVDPPRPRMWPKRSSRPPCVPGASSSSQGWGTSATG